MLEPLRVTAHLRGQVVITDGALALDALLAYWVAMREQRPPLSVVPADQQPELTLPLEKEPGGRFYLASFAVPRFDGHEVRYLNKRFPLAEAQGMGNAALKRINLTSGATKSYRIPVSSGHVEGDRLDWWCVGDREEVAALLACVRHLGRRRGVGSGEVAHWEVEPCEPWEGFPMVRDGKPLRPLPLDWPGLRDAQLGWAPLTFPYWDRTREVECAVPERTC